MENHEQNKREEMDHPRMDHSEMKHNKEDRSKMVYQHNASSSVDDFI